MSRGWWVSQSGFPASLASPYQIKQPLSRSWGQKPKLDSTSRGDKTCKAQLGVMGQRHCKSEPQNLIEAEGREKKVDTARSIC